MRHFSHGKFFQVLTPYGSGVRTFERLIKIGSKIRYFKFTFSLITCNPVKFSVGNLYIFSDEK